MSGTVWSLGSVLVDVAVDVPQLPERGGDLLATASRTEAGGGINLASAVARQGVRCIYSGPHGTGRYGDLVRAALLAEGIEVSGPIRADGDTGFCVTLVEPDGERTFVTAAGVDAALTDTEVAAVRPTGGDVVALSGYDLAYPKSVAVLADWTIDVPAGVTVALDPGPLILDIPAERLAQVLGRVDLLTMNQREARLFADSTASAAELLAGVRGHDGVHLSTLVVVREGPDGCVASGGWLGDRAMTVTAPPVEAVDTTGAGDTHTGVLLAGLAEGLDGLTALRRATYAAALSVTLRGPATAPTRAELDRHLGSG